VAEQASPVAEGELVVAGTRVFVRSTDGEGVPTVFVHGHPTSSEDWLPFMERLDAPALAPDLPGWGRSESPPTDRFDYGLEGLGGFLGRWLDAAGVNSYNLVCHDWGVVSLIAAQAAPERIERLVVINAVPLMAGYRWHWVARLFWRRRLLGELANATTTRAGLRLILRQATPRPGSMPDEFVDQVLRDRPRGTWPQALRLYRSAGGPALAAAGARLGELGCPALVLWGADDPYIPLEFAHRYAEVLPDAELDVAEGAGHWPWIDRPELVDRVLAFLRS
jgi:pimeloyl-ACP methyl ester carboxylesterase